MRVLKLIAALTMGVSVAACGAMPDIASRNAPFEATQPSSAQDLRPKAPFQPTAMLETQTPLPMTVKAININVPGALKVSEANTYYPSADIVWRGDPVGNRRTQITEIFETAFKRGTVGMDGSTPVILDVELVRFHSVTEKTRYSVGGVHNIMFKLTVRRASTGAALAPTRFIEADLPALGGRSAMEADRKGQTQKVRVTDHLALVIQQELSRFVAG
ncbi:putative lipoprotein [Sulfitobacter noctilucicola]|uniref:Lipoprotein n=1 Tax=Sulfitobacter noctilucicola TaxID=1342301 RepID=A0A7W6MCL2_9RHOB|nr:DUF6778 family protein [Sulfitobacter noctilucicola]KIN66425.1 putative lipoprotein [Sulfitobacter noctilucicola]MBB4175772.1 hypothetical protein [Sulfitobacter noctilucicola]